MSDTANDLQMLTAMQKMAQDMSGLPQSFPNSNEIRMQEIEHQLGIQHRKIIALENDNELLKEIIEDLENVL